MSVQPNLVELPADTDSGTTVGLLSHSSPGCAQADPHRAMQVHRACQVSVCITKTIAFLELARRGALVPDSCRVGSYLHALEAVQ